MATQKTKEEISAENEAQPKIPVSFPIEPQVPEAPANVVLKLIDHKRMGGVNIDGEDFVFDPEYDNGAGKSKGKQRKAILLDGVNTIWVDEHTKNIDKDFISRHKRSLQFSKLTRECVIPHYDKTAILFAQLSNSNIENPYRQGVKPVYFNVWNPLLEEEREAQATQKMLDAVAMAATMPYEDMVRHAIYLGVPVTDAIGNKLTEKGLRAKYIQKANQKPVDFMKSANSEEVNVAYAIQLLVSNGTIDLEHQQGQAYYKNGGYICPIAPNVDATKQLIQFAIADAEVSKNFAAKVRQLAKI